MRIGFASVRYTHFQNIYLGLLIIFCSRRNFLMKGTVHTLSKVFGRIFSAGIRFCAIEHRWIKQNLNPFQGDKTLCYNILFSCLLDLASDRFSCLFHILIVHLNQNLVENNEMLMNVILQCREIFVQNGDSPRGGLQCPGK